MEIDDVDQAILFLLQERGRSDLSYSDIADQIDVSQSTVGSRISRLRENGVLQHFRPIIDYEKVGLSHHVLFMCAAPLDQRNAFAERILDLPKTVNVRELLSTDGNLHVEVVASNPNEIEAAASQIEELGVEIVELGILRREHSRAFDDFASEAVHRSKSDSGDSHFD